MMANTNKSIYYDEGQPIPIFAPNLSSCCPNFDMKSKTSYKQFFSSILYVVVHAFRRKYLPHFITNTHNPTATEIIYMVMRK